METFLTILHVFVGLVLIMVVLLQTGKGNAMGSAFGGSSQTVFGASGAGNFLTKFTTGAAIAFMLTSLILSSMSSKRGESSLVTTEETSAPVQPSQTAPLPVLPAETTPAETGPSAGVTESTGTDHSPVTKKTE